MLGQFKRGKSTLINALAGRELLHVDAAILVVGVDPAITGDELALLRDVGSQVRTVIVVLAKADRATDAEIEEARRFTTSSSG